MVVVDGMQGGTAATQDVFIEHTGIPTLAAVRHGRRRPGATWAWPERCSWSCPAASVRGADVAKALALGADAVSIGVAALLALGCNSATYPGPDGARST